MDEMESKIGYDCIRYARRHKCGISFALDGRNGELRAYTIRSSDARALGDCARRKCGISFALDRNGELRAETIRSSDARALGDCARPDSRHDWGARLFNFCPWCGESLAQTVDRRNMDDFTKSITTGFPG